jgi:hypothetical protein
MKKNHKIINNTKKINQFNNNTIKSLQPNMYYDNETKILKEFNNNNSFNDVIVYSQDNNILIINYKKNI